MSGKVLCIGAEQESWADRLVAEGYHVLSAADAEEGIAVLQSQLVDVVCIDSRAMETVQDEKPGTNLKSIDPQLPVVLVQTQHDSPLRFKELVDVVMDGRSFDIRGSSIIEELKQARFPFFVEWFDDWKQNCAQKLAQDNLATS